MAGRREQHPQWPVDRGFEQYFGLIAGDDNYFKPVRQMALENESCRPTDPDFYMTDAFGQKAVRYIDEYSKKPISILICGIHGAPFAASRAPRRYREIPRQISKRLGRA